MDERRDIDSAIKMFLNLFGGIFASWEAKSRFGNNVSRGAWDIMFPQQCSVPGLPRALQL